MKVEEPLFDYINPSVKYEIVNGDALPTLSRFPNGHFDLIVTSPPYNLGKKY
jgi:DNA modification methylase